MSDQPPQATPAPPGAAGGFALRLEVEPADLAILRRHRRLREGAVTPPRARRLESVTFDTPALELLRRGIALRVRRAGRRFVQTLELPAGAGGGLLEGAELESPLRSGWPDPQQVPHAELRGLVAQAVATPGFAAVLETALQRTARSLRLDDTDLDLVLDVGAVHTPRGPLAICELTLALTRGEVARLWELAIELQRSVRLRVSTRPRHERVLEQLTGAHPTPRGAKPIALPEDATLEQAMEASFRTSLDQILANEEPARRGVDPEGVHQMRIGVRRLRSALSLFRRVLPDAQRRELREELRWLGGELGDARDLDVFGDETLAVLRRRFHDDPQLKRIADETAQMRAQAYSRVRGCLESVRYAELVLQLGHWLAAREWRQQPTTPDSAQLFLPARDVGRRLLRRRHRKMLRSGGDLAQRSRAELHALRIQAKKLRFASEFLGSLYPEKRTRPFVRRTRRLQDALGHLNDVAAAREMLARVLERLGPETDAAMLRTAGFVEGWISRGAEGELARLPQRWKALEDERPFWKGHAAPP